MHGSVGWSRSSHCGCGCATAAYRNHLVSGRTQAYRQQVFNPCTTNRCAVSSRIPTLRCMSSLAVTKTTSIHEIGMAFLQENCHSFPHTNQSSLCSCIFTPTFANAMCSSKRAGDESEKHMCNIFSAIMTNQTFAPMVVFHGLSMDIRKFVQLASEYPAIADDVRQFVRKTHEFEFDFLCLIKYPGQATAVCFEVKKGVSSKQRMKSNKQLLRNGEFIAMLVKAVTRCRQLRTSLAMVRTEKRRHGTPVDLNGIHRFDQLDLDNFEESLHDRVCAFDDSTAKLSDTFSAEEFEQFAILVAGLFAVEPLIENESFVGFMNDSLFINRVALPKKVKNVSIAGISSFKARLDVLAHKTKLDLPLYETRLETDDPVQLFRSSVTFRGVKYQGSVRTSKKGAENDAAHICLLRNPIDLLEQKGNESKQVETSNGLPPPDPPAKLPKRAKTKLNDLSRKSMTKWPTFDTQCLVGDLFLSVVTYRGVQYHGKVQTKKSEAEHSAAQACLSQIDSSVEIPKRFPLKLKSKLFKLADTIKVDAPTYETQASGAGGYRSAVTFRGERYHGEIQSKLQEAEHSAAHTCLLQNDSLVVFAEGENNKHKGRETLVRAVTTRTWRKKSQALAEKNNEHKGRETLMRAVANVI